MSIRMETVSWSPHITTTSIKAINKRVGRMKTSEIGASTTKK